MLLGRVEVSEEVSCFCAAMGFVKQWEKTYDNNERFFSKK